MLFGGVNTERTLVWDWRELEAEGRAVPIEWKGVGRERKQEG